MCPYTLLQEGDTVSQDSKMQFFHFIILMIKLPKYVLYLPGFFVVFGWSAGFSVQLSRLLGPGRDSAVGDASVGGLLLVSESEVVS